MTVGALLAAVCIGSVSCGINSSKTQFEPTAEDKKIVMTVGGENVEYQEYRYFFLNNKRDSFGADEQLTNEQTDELIAMTEENSRHRHALIKMADKYGAKLTAEEIKEADAYVDEYRKTYFGSDEEYLLALDEQYMTDYLFRELTKESTLAYSVLDKMKESGAIIRDGEEFDKVLESDEIICIKEIYVAFTTEANRDIAEKRAEEALGKLMSGAEFEDMMREYSDYNEKELSPEHGYYTMKFDALDVIYDAAAGLAEGEYSYVIESEYGFHIVKRCPKDAEYMETIREEIYENYTYAKFSEEYDSFMDTMEIVYTEYGASIDFSAVS